MVDIFLQLIIYSFLVWCCESVYCSLGRGEWINRGFLTGPFCPIYGFGAVAALAFLKFLPSSVLVVFVGGMVITSTLEYITSWLLPFVFSSLTVIIILYSPSVHIPRSFSSRRLLIHSDVTDRCEALYSTRWSPNLMTLQANDTANLRYGSEGKF